VAGAVTHTATVIAATIEDITILSVSGRF